MQENIKKFQLTKRERMAWVVKDKISKELASETQIQKRIERAEKATNELKKLKTSPSVLPSMLQHAPATVPSTPSLLASRKLLFRKIL